jgi:hypothetical protein
VSKSCASCDRSWLLRSHAQRTSCTILTAAFGPRINNEISHVASDTQLAWPTSMQASKTTPKPAMSLKKKSCKEAFKTLATLILCVVMSMSHARRTRGTSALGDRGARGGERGRGIDP